MLVSIVRICYTAYKSNVGILGEYMTKFVKIMSSVFMSFTLASQSVMLGALETHQRPVMPARQESTSLVIEGDQVIKVVGTKKRNHTKSASTAAQKARTRNIVKWMGYSVLALVGLVCVAVALFWASLPWVGGALAPSMIAITTGS